MNLTKTFKYITRRISLPIRKAWYFKVRNNRYSVQHIIGYGRDALLEAIDWISECQSHQLGAILGVGKCDERWDDEDRFWYAATNSETEISIWFRCDSDLIAAQLIK